MYQVKAWALVIQFSNTCFLLHILLFNIKFCWSMSSLRLRLCLVSVISRSYEPSRSSNMGNICWIEMARIWPWSLFMNLCAYEFLWHLMFNISWVSTELLGLHLVKMETAVPKITLAMCFMLLTLYAIPDCETISFYNCVHVSVSSLAWRADAVSFSFLYSLPGIK